MTLRSKGLGADVQMALVKELLEAMKRANAAYNGCRMHHLDRLNLVHDWAKFPNMMVSVYARPS